MKPICPFHQIFQSLYLFGAFSPINGQNFLMQSPNCNAEAFQLFLNEFSNQNPNEFKLMLLDNGAFHKAKSLKIPNNIALLFIPPYSPELNPAEKIWAIYKRDFTNRLFKTIEKLDEYLYTLKDKLTSPQIKTTCSYNYFFSDHFWSMK